MNPTSASRSSSSSLTSNDSSHTSANSHLSNKTPSSTTSHLNNNDNNQLIRSQVRRFPGSMGQEGAEDDPLLAGFALLRVAQLINLDIYYIGLGPGSSKAARASRLGDLESASRLQLCASGQLDSRPAVSRRSPSSQHLASPYYSTVLDELAQFNPLQRHIDRHWWLDAACRLLKICVSLIAIMFSLAKTLATVALCLIARLDGPSGPSAAVASATAAAAAVAASGAMNVHLGPPTTHLSPEAHASVYGHSVANHTGAHLALATNMSQPHVHHPAPAIQAPAIQHDSSSKESNNTVMGLFVLVLVNLSSTYIIYSTVFNGHQLWNLLSQRLFLVSRRFQFNTMLCLLVFIYVEYLLDVAFINHLYAWDFSSDNIESSHYSLLASLRALVKESHPDNSLVDNLLTVIQFARGIVRISPYITLNYVVICLKHHLNMIRRQRLLTESLRRRPGGGSSALAVTGGGGGGGGGSAVSRTGTVGTRIRDSTSSTRLSDSPSDANGQRRAVAFIELAPEGLEVPQRSGSKRREPQRAEAERREYLKNLGPNSSRERDYLGRIADFGELESYVTNLYLFTDRLNRIMANQGLSIFFIVHNLLISIALIHPQATQQAGQPVEYLSQGLLLATAMLPFVFGQALRAELGHLSRQIDRIIIQQQFTFNKRDVLLRIRELLQEIQVNCGGMLNLRLENGIKYLVVAFASAFFIEQERKYSSGAARPGPAPTWPAGGWSVGGRSLWRTGGCWTAWSTIGIALCNARPASRSAAIAISRPRASPSERASERARLTKQRLANHHATSTCWAADYKLTRRH